jgi:hypothetical protein
MIEMTDFFLGTHISEVCKRATELASQKKENVHFIYWGCCCRGGYSLMPMTKNSGAEWMVARRVYKGGYSADSRATS